MANNRGMALIPTLTISLVALLLGFSAMYVSEMGYRSISAEARWQMLEKIATGQAKKFVADVIGGSKQCGNTVSGSLNGVSYNVVSVKAGDSCFIWSSATVGNSRVTKVAYFPLMSSNYGAVMFKNPGNLNISGNAYISGCESGCSQHAMMGGDYPQNYPNGGNNFDKLPGSCDSNEELRSQVTPAYKKDENLKNRDFVNEFFNLNGKSSLEERLTELYKVKFNNNGEPTGIDGPQCYTSSIEVASSNFTSYTGGINIFGTDVITLNNYNPNNCYATGKNITCECSGNSNVRNYNITCVKMNFIWNENEKKYEYKLDLRLVGNLINLSITGLPVGNCQAINLGQNTNLYIGKSSQNDYSEFEGGGTVYSGQVYLEGNSKNNLNIIVYNQVQDSRNNIEIENMNIFTKNISLSKENTTILNSFIYSGGKGSGNINISLKGNSQIGSQDKPTMIISDNNIAIDLNGNAKVYGFIFETHQSNNLSVTLNGNSAIEGAVISNTTENRNSNISLSGSSYIKFNKNVLDNLKEKYTDRDSNSVLLKGISCGSSVNRKSILTQTMITVY